MVFASMNTVLSNLGFVCALGVNHADIVENARRGATDGMLRERVAVGGDNVPFGMVPIATTQNMRFCDLIDAALNQIIDELTALREKFPAHRLGIVIGASNTAVHEAQKILSKKFQTGEMPDGFSISMLELGTPATYIKSRTGFGGPCFTISTACSSSIKALDTARDLITNDICDAVLCGGVDARCDFALNGFNALEALSHKLTNPMSQNRDGINLGESAALFIMRRGDDGVRVLGCGETTDAYHPTAPDPTGNGAKQSMRDALADAGLDAADIEYINMHGTGTIANDAMESRAIYDVFGDKTLCASTKPLTGHCLGAAGACSVALSWLMLKHDFVIPHVFDGVRADDCAPINLCDGATAHVKNILCNAFAFGGSNSSIIIGR